MKEARSVKGQADQGPDLKTKVEEIEETLALVLILAMIRNLGNVVGIEKIQGNDNYRMFVRNMSSQHIFFHDYSNHN